MTLCRRPDYVYKNNSSKIREHDLSWLIKSYLPPLHWLSFYHFLSMVRKRSPMPDLRTQTLQAVSAKRVLPMNRGQSGVVNVSEAQHHDGRWSPADIIMACLPLCKGYNGKYKVGRDYKELNVLGFFFLKGLLNGGKLNTNCCQWRLCLAQIELVAGQTCASSAEGDIFSSFPPITEMLTG